MAGRYLHQGITLCQARFRYAETLAESAAFDVVLNGRNHAGDGREYGFAFVIPPGHGGEQGSCISMARIAEELRHLCTLDYATAIHDQHPVAVLRDYPQIVGDEDGGSRQVATQFPEEVENLLLHRDVEGGSRLVCNDEFGVAKERNRYHNALTHTTRKFVGVFFVNALGVGNAYEFEHFDTSLFYRLL